MDEAILESADEFLNGEIPGYDPSEWDDAVKFAAKEAERFQIMLRVYLQGRIEAGDYVRE